MVDDRACLAPPSREDADVVEAATGWPGGRPASIQHPCGHHQIVTDLPELLGVLSGEADLLAVHLADWLATLLPCEAGEARAVIHGRSLAAEPDVVAGDRRI